MPTSALARRCRTHATDPGSVRPAGARRRRTSPRGALLAAALAATAGLAAPLVVPVEAQQQRPARAASGKAPLRKAPVSRKTPAPPPRAQQAAAVAAAAAAAAARQQPPARYAAPVLTFATLPAMPARSGDLTGIVTDSNGVAIPAAEVYVVAFRIVVYTDDKGAFRLPALPPGDHELRVRRIGFHPRTRVLSTQAGESWQLLVALDPAPVTLTAVGVTANVGLGKMAAFERRRKGNVGMFVTRDQIAARKAMLLSDIVRTLPGVTMARGRNEDKVQMRPAPLGGRWDCSPDFYVDGLYVPGLNIDAIPPGDVQGIELYRGPSDTPVDFRSMNAPCGVVAIWTRDPSDKRQLP